MTRRPKWNGWLGFAAGFALAAAGAATAERTRTAPAPESLPFAFVDVASALDGSEKLERLEAIIRRDHEAGRAELARRAREIEAKRGELELVTLGTESWRRLSREIRLLSAALEFDERELERDSVEKVRRAHRDVYRDLDSAAREVAERRGFAAVFATSPPDSAESGTSDVFRTIAFRSVLYFAGDRDVTRDVVIALNGK